MTSVSQFAQYLLKLDPQRNPARLTFYNYLKHIVDPNEFFTPHVVHDFYARVLQFDQWLNDAQNLSETVKSDLISFLRQSLSEKEAQDWNALRHPDTLQLVPIRQACDFEDLALSEHAPRQKSGDRVKTIKLSEAQILVLILSTTGSLEAKVYPQNAMVWGSRLRLVTPVTHLHYTSEFELMPHVRQVLEGSLLTTHSFRVDNEGVHGLVTRGYTFQKYETYIRARLPDTNDLFSSLKKVERHFINPQSDHFYQEIVSRLERANRLIGHGSAEALNEAERALNRGRLILKSIFPNDRLLTLLVTHLDYGISQRQQAPTQFEHATQ